MTDQVTQPKQPATWRIVLAAILDFFTAFWVFGFLVAALFGGRTESGFELNGLPALLCFALIVGYFVVFNKFFGGTIWKRLLKARR
ncbi:hypothetical protein [Agrobacterium larrymoorei]|uniref:RDD family protein n=1 Tax=Agrobacterium larrymoorei TaxID=160699 RepID=A0A4D7DNU2_9HYPH|nr:hypothetical protein [Agrobacterium larrymoorei]QCI97818.1 hypothetical protein CFBP5473_07750 [Agrobacterium larrymoorei]QYA06734.1 hypothetical protein J5285_11950 [Agrobacterium larrymoorei]